MSEPTRGQGPASGAVFYSYRDATGQTVVVDGLDKVPERYRPTVVKLVAQQDRDAEPATDLKLAKDGAKRAIEEAKELKEAGVEKAESLKREFGEVVPFLEALDPPSVAVGFGVALAVYVALAFLRRTGRVLIKVALLLAVVALLGGAYFAWIQRAAGLSDAKLTHPGAMVDEAKKAARKMKSRLREQERTLEKIEEGSR